jgi:hypothetical protein
LAGDRGGQVGVKVEGGTEAGQREHPPDLGRDDGYPRLPAFGGSAGVGVEQRPQPGTVAELGAAQVRNDDRAPVPRARANARVTGPRLVMSITAGKVTTAGWPGACQIE